MKVPSFIGLVDVIVAIVVVFAVVLPPREMHAEAPSKGTEAARFALALAEARTLAHPGDGALIDDLSHQLGGAGFKDWAVEAAQRGTARAQAERSPSTWRAMLATSVAYVDRLDVVPALAYANDALTACTAVQQGGGGACPTWEEVRMRAYQQHLDAGVKSGIDPHRDPLGFRAAGERGLRTVRIGGGPAQSAPTPAPAAGSATGSGAGSAAPP
jgi:hypothetical protein